MTLKQFLKSKAFKCVLVLTIIALIAGGGLAILNDVLFISDEERAQKAITEIYGASVAFTAIQVEDGYADGKNGAIMAVYGFDDGNYMLKAQGKNGYKNGTVTVWILAEFSSGEFTGIKKVVLDSYESQTLMASFGADYYTQFADESNVREVLNGSRYTSGEDGINAVVSGATRTSDAINNAINAGMDYIVNVLGAKEADNG